jgi:hypothetical protein
MMTILEQAWENYRLASPPLWVAEGHGEAHRAAFFAGARAVLAVLHALGKEDAPADRVRRVFLGLCDEVEPGVDHTPWP